MSRCEHGFETIGTWDPCPDCETEAQLAALEAHGRELEAENARLQIQAEMLGDQVCQFHDTNPLNETVVELERARDALEAENRVVRELVEDALDFLWSANRQAYDGILARCTWMVGEETPIDAEGVLERLGIRIEVLKVTTGVWEVRVNGSRVGVASFESTAIEDARILSETLAQSVRTAVDPLLARVAALTREYQDYMTIAGHCTAVYSHFSGGRISKPFTLPFEVIAEAEAIQQEDFEEWHRERLEPIKDRLQDFVVAWDDTWDGHRGIGEELADWIEETFKETS